MVLTKDLKILIVGLGLIGGSYAMGLSKAGYDVSAIDLNAEAIDYAIEHQMIKEGKSVPDANFIGKFDLIISALYPKTFIEWIKTYQKDIKHNAKITDVTGVKSSITNEIQTILRSDLEFIGAHPMAGREVSGVQNSDDSIFINANYIVTPTDKNTDEGVCLVRSIGEVLKFKNIVTLSPEAHDEMIGFLSQLTHCIAVALMTCKDCDHMAAYTGDSFRDLTRIARINENMWTELFLMNKKELLSQMDLFLEQFKKIKIALENEDTGELKTIMRLSTERRKKFDK